MSLPQLLFVHPWGHLNDLVVPVGAVSAMNAVGVPKLGRYAFEASDEELRAARVVALDLHWALAFAGLEPMLRRIRGLNAEARIVVGGVAASAHPKTVLERFDVDYVVQGDAEDAFPTLVEALLDGREPPPIPNIHRRNAPAPDLARVSAERFDASDGLTTDWFPTLSRVSTWDFASYPACPVLNVARGCAASCSTCQGTIGETFGRGVLVRSPTAVVRDTKRALAAQPRSVLLFLGRLSHNRLHALVTALAEAGPFPFPERAAIHLCTAPSPEDLEALLRALPCQLLISAIYLRDISPPLSDPTAAAEVGAWRHVAELAIQSGRLELEMWVTTAKGVARARDELRVMDTPRVSVRHDETWDVTRPIPAREGTDLDEVLDAVRPMWTFHVARLLSPALSRFLAPFKLLDDLTVDPIPLIPRLTGLETIRDIVVERWQRHRLPSIPGLTFAALPIEARSSVRDALGVHHLGDITIARELGSPDLHRSRVLDVSIGADGVTLESPPLVVGNGEALALVPLLPNRPLDEATVSVLAAHALTVIRPRRPGALRLVLAHRIQRITALGLDAAGREVARGIVHLGHVNDPARQRARADHGKRSEPAR